jgi:hypothetical protein
MTRVRLIEPTLFSPQAFYDPARSSKDPARIANTPTMLSRRAASISFAEAWRGVWGAGMILVVVAEVRATWEAFERTVRSGP